MVTQQDTQHKSSNMAIDLWINSNVVNEISICFENVCGLKGNILWL